MSAIAESSPEGTKRLAHSLAQALVPGVSPQILAEVVRADREAHEQAVALDRLSGVMVAATAAAKRFEVAWRELAVARRQDRHRQLFGHQLARVFILGGRLVVVHPRRGEA